MVLGEGIHGRMISTSRFNDEKNLGSKHVHVQYILIFKHGWKDWTPTTRGSCVSSL